MADSGLIRFINRGLRFATSKASATYVGLKTTADPATSFDFVLPATLPGSTQSLVVSSAGVLSYLAPGGGGSVSSVAVTTPADFTVLGSPVTTAGTIALTRASQSANLVLASPSGGAGVPTYRALTGVDVPSLLASKISDFDAQVRTNRLDQLASPTASVSVNNQLLTGLASPVGNQDAANKQYVDAALTSQSNKGSARVASTASITLTAPGAAIDGVSLTVGDLLLATQQATGAENGLYVWNGPSVAATRATSADTSAEVKSGMFVFAQSGAVNGSNGFTLVTADPIVLGTTSLSFVQTSGAGQILAGAGLTKTGNSLDVVGTAGRLTVAADSIDIAGTYAGQTSITTLGTIVTGAWQGTAIAIASGGTGATTAAAARANLGASTVFRQSFTNASLTSGLLTLAHTTDQQYVAVKVYDGVNKLIAVLDDVTCTAVNSLVIDLTSFGVLVGTWNVVVVG